MRPRYPWGCLLRMGAFLSLEARYQFRHGLVTVYIGVAVIYAVILRLLPAELRPIVAPLVILTEPVMVGFFFFGAVFLLERDAGLLAPLSVLPVHYGEALGARLIAFAVTATAAGATILLLGAPEVFLLPGTRPAAALFLVFAASVLFGLFGFLVALGSVGLNAYLIRTALPFVLIAAPMLVFVPPTRSVVWLAFPSGGVTGLIAWSLGGALPAVPWPPIVGGAATLVWLAAAGILAARGWERHRDRLLGVWT